MEVSKVSLRTVEKDRVKAIASITFDDEFVVHGLRVVDGEKGLFVAMPSRKLPSGKYRDIAHPINTSMRERMQAAVLDEFESSKSGNVIDSIDNECVDDVDEKEFNVDSETTVVPSS